MDYFSLGLATPPCPPERSVGQRPLPTGARILFLYITVVVYCDITFCCALFRYVFDSGVVVTG